MTDIFVSSLLYGLTLKFLIVGLSNQKLNIIEIIKACIIELPPAHYLTLKYLMEHLSK